MSVGGCGLWINPVNKLCLTSPTLTHTFIKTNLNQIMKQHLLFLYVCVLLIAGLLPAAHAQIGFNSPTGVKPTQDFEVYTRNSFLVQQKYTFTTADPNASVNTLSCAASPPTLTAPAGILKDPGGDSNYPASLTCTQTVIHGISVSGYEVIFEDLDTEDNSDLVKITDTYGGVLIFSGRTLPTPFFVTGFQFSVRFQANGNSTVGRGFRLRWRAVYADNTTPTTPNTAFGNALQFDTRKGALVGGSLTTGAIQQAGDYSITFGLNNNASGQASTVLGSNNTTSGDYSTALGSGNTASGDYSTALGFLNTASGFASTAMGQNTASGVYSTAMGLANRASGNYSTAMGNYMSTGGQQGSFAIGDSDPLGQGITGIGIPDQFVARFRGGYYLITSGNSNRTGIYAVAGGTSWTTISDSTRKERFLPIDGPDLLRKISGMKLTTWNYKQQRDRRHYGPMAQEFNSLFGRDALGPIGCDTLISTQDIEGLTLTAVQALVKENERLQVETQHLTSLLAQTEAQTNARLDQANARIEALEALLTLRRRGRLVARK
jgi:hypothetical protein